MNSQTAGTAPINNGPQARVTRTLRKWLKDGTIPNGDHLPSERVLCERLEVSRNTVRRALVLLSKEGLLVKAGPRHRVAAAMADNQPKWFHTAIAVLIPALKDRPASYIQSWLDYIAHGVYDAVQDSGMHAISLNPKQLSMELVRRFAADRPLGAVVPEIFSDAPQTVELINTLKNAGVPVVAYGGHAELSHVDRVMSDHHAGSYMLTHWLIARGCRRIVNVFPLPLDRYWLNHRRAGYEQAMREHNLDPLPTVAYPVGPDSVHADQYLGAVRHMATQLINAFSGGVSADALMFGTDRDAIVAAEACRIFNREPNKDITIVGYDNYLHLPEFTAAQSRGVAATVDKCNPAMGHEMVRLLLDRVAGKLPHEPVCRVVKPRLVVNGQVHADEELPLPVRQSLRPIVSATSVATASPSEAHL